MALIAEYIRRFLELSAVESSMESNVVKSVESFIRSLELHYLKYFIVCYT